MVGLLIVLKAIDFDIARWSRKVMVDVIKGLRCFVRASAEGNLLTTHAPSFPTGCRDLLVRAASSRVLFHTCQCTTIITALQLHRTSLV